MTACTSDYINPALEAWDAYRKTGWFRNAQECAKQDAQLDQSLYEMFQAGWKAALAQPVQEPDYWLGYGLQAHIEKPFDDATPLYTAPPRREWVGLTAEETSGFTSHEMTVVKYVSKVLQEKNNGT